MFDEKELVGSFDLSEKSTPKGKIDLNKEQDSNHISNSQRLVKKVTYIKQII